MKQRIDVFISSTSIDLPEHRAAVKDAIISLGLYPSGMETWPVRDENPVDLCYGMVQEAEIYVGIYAHRYGWRPDGDGTKSITEMEYDWATERGIPRLCFIMDDSHPWPVEDIEHDAKDDLNAFKARVKERVVGFFTSPDDLKAQVTAALSPYAQHVIDHAALPYLRWLHNSARQSGLLRAMDPRTNDPSFTGKQVTIDDIYTPLDTTRPYWLDEDGNPIDDELARRMPDMTDVDVETVTQSAIDVVNVQPQLVLLGDPGSGKSTFVNYLAVCLSGCFVDSDADWLTRLEAQGWQHGTRLPVLVTLRDFAEALEGDTGTAQMLREHIEHTVTQHGDANAAQAVLDAIGRGQALVLLDGLDEVPNDKREVVRDAVTDFVRSGHANTRYIVTCRILSYTHEAWQIPDMVSETIAPFDRHKINHYISAWYRALNMQGMIDDESAEQRTGELQGLIEQYDLENVASNPMLLTVMTLVHNHTGTLPRERARLYSECVDLLMLRWRPHDARYLMEELDVHDMELRRLLWEIAYDAHSTQTEDEGTADIAEPDLIFMLRDRLGDLHKAEVFCNYVEQRAGLLIGRGQDAKNRRVFTFPHRTFQEYLAGCYVANNRFRRTVRELARESSTWREVLLLATGQLIFNDGDNAEVIDAIELICDDDPRDDGDWRAVWMAGEMALLVGKRAMEGDRYGKAALTAVRHKLADLCAGGHLPPVERAAAGRILAQLGDPRPGVGVIVGATHALPLPDIEWVEIPAGTFLMGSDPDKDEWAREREQPQHEVMLPRYDIARYPTTVAQYEPFVADGGYDNPDYWTEAGWQWREVVNISAPEYWQDPTWHISNHPVVGVTWYEAMAYCAWLDALLGRSAGRSTLRPYETIITLPTEAQWEKA
ncbi:MAG: DUF4062 domain-containing protein, partial [Chloroflexi bacterium]